MSVKILLQNLNAFKLNTFTLCTYTHVHIQARARVLFPTDFNFQFVVLF